MKNVKVQDVRRFTYSGSIVTSGGGADEDVKSRTGKARQAFLKVLKYPETSVELNINIHKNQAVRIFTTNVISLLPHGSETWTVTRSILNKQTFTYQCLRKTLKIYYPEKISNRELWEEKSKNVLQHRSPCANRIGLATHCGNQHLTQPDRP